MENPPTVDGEDESHKRKEILRKRMLDLCFKEGWTYDENTQNSLLEFSWTKMKDEKDMSKGTQSFLRHSYTQFMTMNPLEEWNKTDCSDKRDLWAVEQAFLHSGQSPSWQDIKNLAATGDLASLCNAANACDEKTLQHKDLVNEYLDVLQHDWLPEISGSLNDNKDEWRAEVFETYRKAIGHFQPDAVPKPTLGFLHQLLQDMESKSNFLSKVKSGESTKSIEQIKFDVNLPLTPDPKATNGDDHPFDIGESENKSSQNLGDSLSDAINENGPDDKLEPGTKDHLPTTQREGRKALDNDGRIAEASMLNGKPESGKEATESEIIENSTGGEETKELEPKVKDGSDALKNHSTNGKTKESLPSTSIDTAAGIKPQESVEATGEPENNSSTNLAQTVVNDDGSFLKTFVGRRVYAEFPNNQQWYWGIVTNVQINRSKSPSFSVWFDDGDSLDDLSGKNILTVEEYEEKWQHIFKKPPPKLPKFLREAEFDEKNHRIIVDESFSPSNTDTEDATDKKNEAEETRSSKFDENLGKKKKASKAKNKNKTDGTASKKRKQKEEELSSSKEIGSRVYCKWKNDNYYWGEIIGKSLDDDLYVVQLDDGDVTEIKDDCENEIEQNIFTETEYKKIAGKDPPKKRRKMSTFRTLTSQEIFNLRCNACSYCEMDSCGKCSWCKKSEKKSSGTNYVCLQNIPYEKKKQIAPGFPSRWTFATGEESMFSNTNFCGLMICSPDGDKFSDLDKAIKACRGLSRSQIEKLQVQFQSFLGGSVLYSDENHHLHQKPYMSEWTDVNGSKKVLYGTITECMLDKTDAKHTEFTVVYNDDSRADVHGIGEQLGLEVPRTQTLNKAKAFGGNSIFNMKAGFPSSALLQNAKSFRWMTPDMRTESIISNESGTKLPRLVLTWNGFRLVFSARKSTIPESGFGVFVECTSLIPGRKKMVLNESEMLDLGVYAPFRPEDLKLSCVFLLKNYVHNLKCEEWSFDVESKNDTLQFDITNDHDGELHEIAAKHIPAYVNECRIEENPTVHARHDPEGAVHYLFGLLDKKFVLPADGRPSEIFINYGPDYERVRIRKDYSFLPASDQEPFKKTASREGAEYFLELIAFGEREVSSCIRFFRDTFASANISCPSVVSRSLAVAVLLRHRGRALQKEMESSNPFTIEFQSDLSDCDVLIEKLLCLQENQKLKELNERNESTSLIQETITPLLSELEDTILQRVLSAILENKGLSFEEVISDPSVEL